MTVSLKGMVPKLIGLSAFLLGFLVLKYADVTAVGVKNGINLCLETVIPSLFVFMVIAEFVSRTELLEVLFLPLRFIPSLFRLPGECVSVFALSLLGGYPMGAQMISNLVKSKRISPKEGEILLCSSVNCSPSFMVGAVGIGVFKNPQLGFVLYLSQVVAAVITGIVAGFFVRKEERKTKVELTDTKTNYAQNFVDSVLYSGKAMLTICSFVILFSVLLAFMQKIKGFEFLAGLTEVSVGCSMLRGKSFKTALFLSAFYTSFGGICVFSQIKSFLNKSGVKMRKFFISRILYVALSIAFSFYGVRFVDTSESVFSNVGKVLPSGGGNSALASVFLILLCFMLLISKKSCGIINSTKMEKS